MISTEGVDPELDYDEDEVVSDHAWEESGKFEGDLILNERQRRLIVEDVAEGLARNGIRDGAKRWPNNEVIVYIQVEHFTSDQVQAIESGIEDIARASCVKFRRYKKGDRDAVVIQGNRRGCFSQVGYQGGYQVLNLSGRHPVGRGCFRHGTVVHELLHTLGFYHMQSSPDRDDYVKIVWENIVQPARHNFRKYNSFSVSDFGVGYDYDSVLHYSQRAFSANGQDTIVPKQSGAQIGQRVGLSDKDTQKLNKMYCDADSDSAQADENNSKKTESKKKNPRNKPFEGHGIGYHQGKAVAIKLLPAPETYKLPDVPSFHVFDYFSKEPQILSTSENEGFRIGKEIAYSYSPPEPMSTTRENHVPVNLDQVSEIKPDHNVIIQEQSVKIAEENGGNSQHEEQQSDSKSDVDETTHDQHPNLPNAENDDPDLIEAFDRLSKIIQMHVYPSHTPDLSIYKKSGRYTDNYHHHTKAESDQLNSPPSVDAEKQKTDKMNSAIQIINSMFEYSSEKSMAIKPNDEKVENGEPNITKGNLKKMPLAVPEKESLPWYKLYDEEYIPVQHFESPKNNYYLKNEKPENNNDDWFQKYVQYYPNDEFHDYSKDSSEGNYDGDTNENLYISSIPKSSKQYSVFHVPNLVTENRYRIEVVSQDNR
uniref:Metalloendopeptidase n=1 Tax=Heliothis virescens TaxID=7102 RepID=A0A2A4K8V5_HELVI